MKPLCYPLRPQNGGPLTERTQFFGRWSHEPKLNGWRALVHVPSGTMFNRVGEELSIAKEFLVALEKLRLKPFEWLDCEALERRHGIGRGALVVLDVVLPAVDYEDRRQLLEENFFTPRIEDGVNAVSVNLVPRMDDPHKLWELCMLTNKKLGLTKPANYYYEGIVSKRYDSTYPIQLVSPDREFPYWKKFRLPF